LQILDIFMCLYKTKTGFVQVTTTKPAMNTGFGREISGRKIASNMDYDRNSNRA